MALLRLDFDRAMQMNLCGIASVAIFGLWWAVAIFEIAAGRRTRLHDWAERRFVVLTAVGLGILLAFGALRIALLASR